MSRKSILLAGGPLVLLIVTPPLLWANRWRFGFGPIDVADLGNFYLDQKNGVDSDIPANFRKLNGKRVTLLGQIWEPWTKDSDFVAGFDLARISATGWGPSPPLVQNFVRCRADARLKIRYFPSSVQAVGILQVGISKEDGRISSVFTMDVESVRAAQ